MPIKKSFFQQRGLRYCGILIGWLVFILNFILLTLLWHVSALGFYNASDFQVFLLLVVNFWAICCFLYGVTLYKPVCALIGLIWYGFLMCCFIYSITPHIDIAITIFIVLLLIVYVFAVLSYKHVKLATKHIRINANSPLSNLSYVVVDRVEVNSLPTYAQAIRPT